MSIQIHDFYGDVKDEAWLAARYGVEIDTSQRRDGQSNFEIVALDEVGGPAEYQVLVLDQAGLPKSGIFVFRSWPGAPGFQFPDNVPHYSDGAVPGQTNANGMVGFGGGTGDYMKNPPGDGVSKFWIGMHTSGSDCLAKSGWMPMTEHWHIRPTFRLVTVDATEPDIPAETNKGCLVTFITVLEAIVKALKG
jgi:hypothetical protein